jgi:RNA polymerase sigma-70 factor (ECF subfamily)
MVLEKLIGELRGSLIVSTELRSACSAPRRLSMPASVRRSSFSGYNGGMAVRDSSDLGRRQGVFATTRWSIVAAAGRRSSADSRQALQSLCEAYWPALYAYARRRESDVHRSQDLTQAFFAELLDKNYVGAADPGRGRFRSFLLTAFQHFLSKQYERANAQKRGGGRSPLSLDFAAADSNFGIEPAGGPTAEQIYDRHWTLALLGRVMERLGQEFVEAGKQSTFEVLKPLLIGENPGASYAQAAASLNLSEAAARQAATRMRRRYRELLREEIAQTVETPDDVEEEIRGLFATLEK